MGIEGKFRVGDAIVIEGTSQDDEVGTILQCVQDEYLVVLEDGVLRLSSGRESRVPSLDV